MQRRELVMGPSELPPAFGSSSGTPLGPQPISLGTLQEPARQPSSGTPTSLGQSGSPALAKAPEGSTPRGVATIEPSGTQRGGPADVTSGPAVVPKVDDTTAPRQTKTRSKSASPEEIGRWEGEGGTIVDTGAKRGPKTDPLAPHNAKIKEVADKLEAEGNTVIAAGGARPEGEQSVSTKGGLKERRRPDIIYVTPDGQVRGVNVGETKADGTPVKREAEALKDLNGAGKLPTHYVPYDR